VGVDRKHFFAYPAALMRSVLTNRHRARTAATGPQEAAQIQVRGRVVGYFEVTYLNRTNLRRPIYNAAPINPIRASSKDGGAGVAGTPCANPSSS
jgi:hypothetical protein